MPMNPERRAEWTAALRSGDYEQTTGRLVRNLHDEDGKPVGRAYCCLGVACELAAKAGIGEGFVLDPDYPEDDPMFVYADADGVRHRESGTLPRPVSEWLGLENENPNVVFDGAPTNLAVINDYRRADFEGIAALIEAQF